MSLRDRVKAIFQPRSSVPVINSIGDLAQALTQYATFNGVPLNGFPMMTLNGEPAERIQGDLVSFATQAYQAHGPIFSLLAVRMATFSGIRFQWQRINGGRPSGLFGNRDLGILETPWTGGSTQDLLLRMILDADLAGNAYITRYQDELIRLRPDWVDIILMPRMTPFGPLGYKRIGYIYWQDGREYGRNPTPIRLEEMCHFAPYPDPLANYRGMSWLTPVIRELQNDKLMTRHQQLFFENGATPNLVVTMDAAVDENVARRFMDIFRDEFEGVENAYKTAFVGGGADVTPVGANFEQMTFTAVQGRMETRLAAAARVPVSIAGFSEGLQGSTLNAGNFQAARRLYADGTLHPLWGNAVSSMQTIIPLPREAPTGAVRLWYDARDVPFLQEDAKDAAEILQIQASTVNALVQAGWTWETALAAVIAQDLSLLQHSGLLSVQLQAPSVSEPSEAESARELAELVQKLYLGVDTVVTWEEARELLNQAGFPLDLSEPPPEDEPAPAPELVPAVNGAAQ